jgi:hypothetical protein
VRPLGFGWLVALSLVVSGAAIAVYSQFLRVAAVRTHPEVVRLTSRG